MDTATPSEPARAARARLRSWLMAALAVGAQAAGAGHDTLTDRVRELAHEQALASQPGVRVEVEVGAVDPRLTLAPCARITPYVPAHARLWGATRLGVRCDEGARWNVFVPLRVRVYSRAVTLAHDLPAGAVLDASQLNESEVDLAADTSPAVRQQHEAVGRALARTLRSGASLRHADLKPRQWFAAGDTVRVRTVGAGFTVLADGQALGPGVEGQLTKVRLDGGRIVSGRASGVRQLEVAL